MKPTLTASLLAAAACVGLAASLAAAATRVSAETAPAPDRTRIVLLPMVVHSAENPDYLRSGLSDMLASRLDRIREFEVIRIDQAEVATTNLEKALAEAGKAQAEFVLFGSFTRFGTGASLDVQCASAVVKSGTPPLREIFVHSGSIGDVIPDLDDLVGKVARFVIHDYSDQASDQAADKAGDASGGPSSRSLSALEKRVEKLEDALRGLSQGISNDVAGPKAAARP
jgi:TolB-like protein